MKPILFHDLAIHVGLLEMDIFQKVRQLKKELIK